MSTTPSKAPVRMASAHLLEELGDYGSNRLKQLERVPNWRIGSF